MCIRDSRRCGVFQRRFRGRRGDSANRAPQQLFRPAGYLARYPAGGGGQFRLGADCDFPERGAEFEPAAAVSGPGGGKRRQAGISSDQSGPGHAGGNRPAEGAGAGHGGGRAGSGAQRRHGHGAGGTGSAASALSLIHIWDICANPPGKLRRRAPGRYPSGPRCRR